MPVYDYRCEECHGLYDVYHKGKEIAGDIRCPVCGSTRSKKLMSVASVKISSPMQERCCDRSASPACAGGCCGGACGMD
jgi:putative FmdB family regulatory protein